MKKYFISALTLFFLTNSSLLPQSKDDQVCLDCHGDRTLTTESNGKVISLFVNGKIFSNSIHEQISCTGCHTDVDPDNLPHPEKLQKVDCSVCHDNESKHYQKSLHGVALSRGVYLAPACIDCHGKHDILPSTNSKSKTYVMNIPSLCGTCHKEGTPVSKLRFITEKHILEDYQESIHGEGLFKRGLIVTAVCTSCHTSHDILPPQDPNSTINRNNVIKTCTKCHRQIEQVHQKVIRGELWEKEPNKIPVCIDCHQPHRVRKVFYDDSFPDDMCMKCHGDKNLYKVKDGKKISLYINLAEFKESVHATNSCIKCHVNISKSKNPVCLNSGTVDCSICHSQQVSDYQSSQHGTLFYKGNPDAPYCTDCHGKHNVLSKNNLKSFTFSKNIPALCSQCHQDGAKATKLIAKGNEHIIKNYTESIHGKGLLQSGLLVTATCIDCHTSHRELPPSDPRSTVNPNNIASTCAKCHLGVYEDFKKSIHSPTVTKTDKKLPVCNTCHESHTIIRTDQSLFRQKIINQCGKCHEDVSKTYFDTFHGKVSKLGEAKAAKCSDCHGSHKILPPDNPNSTLSRANIVQTCKKCHPNSNRKFVGYLTHATHHDKEKYPYLFYTFWFMTILLAGTFTFFGLHTLLWLPRALKEKKKQKSQNHE
ncbi:cytochrome c3 family protein [Melioribacteraceae bacterium 4301-Me]|uniref:cytochrome c3 family protein n=1 Tax=Pyranulibacter aquaticus TaxID=3163344 RepID=UPI0035981C5B